MRIRQIKPSFWEDALIDALPDAVKLFYIGCWQLADDGGYFEWNPVEIARQLYGYQSRPRRERWVRERGEMLAGLGRLNLLECGHAYVCHLTEHQHLPGKPSLPQTTAHLRDCPQIPAEPRNSPLRVGKVGGRLKEGVGEGLGGDTDLSNITDPALRARLLAKGRPA